MCGIKFLKIIKKHKKILMIFLQILFLRYIVPEVVNSTFYAQGISNSAVLWSAAAIIGLEIHAAAFWARGCSKSRALYSVYPISWGDESIDVP